jgi:hypothetical protein
LASGAPAFGPDTFGPDTADGGALGDGDRGPPEGVVDGIDNNGSDNGPAGGGEGAAVGSCAAAAQVRIANDSKDSQNLDGTFNNPHSGRLDSSHRDQYLKTPDERDRQNVQTAAGPN